DMLKFRKEAMRVAAEEQVWSLQDVPGFDNWFLDWVTPKSYRGRRHLVPSKASPSITRPTIAESAAALETPTWAEQKEPETSTDIVVQTRTKMGGRPSDERTQEIMKFCYERYVTEDKGATTVKLEANRLFGATTIKEDS